MRHLLPIALDHLGARLLVATALSLAVGCQPDSPKPNEQPKPAQEQPKEQAAKAPDTAQPDAQAPQLRPEEQVEPQKSLEQLIKEDGERLAKAAQEREDSPKNKFTQVRYTLPSAAGEPLIIQDNIFLFDDRLPVLMWVNNPTSYKVYEQPSEKSKVVGQLKLGTEEKIPWTEMQLIISKPRPFVAKSKLSLSANGQRKLDINHRFGYGEPIEKIEMEPKEVYELFFAPGFGACLARIRGEFYMAACPEPTDFSCDFVPRDYASAPYEALERGLWFKVEHPTASGWLLHDRTEISIGLKHLDWITGDVEQPKESNPPEIDYTKLPQHLQPPPDATVPALPTKLELPKVEPSKTPAP